MRGAPRRAWPGPGAGARIALLLLALAALAGAGCAGLGPGLDREREPVTPLLWRAEDPGSGGVLFLFGSVHVGERDDVDFGPAVEAAFAESEELVVEIDLTEVTPQEVARRMQERARLPPSRRLEDLISPETREALARFLEERGVPWAIVARVKPWFAADLVVALELEAEGYESDYGADQLFLDRAAGALPIVGIETVEAQIDLLDGLPYEVQELLLEDALGRLEGFGDATGDMLDAWERGDEAALEQAVFEPARQNPAFEAFYRAVFYERNETMSARLTELARDGRTRFVVLGAGHMVGERGIPALLRARGLRVVRISDG